VSEGFEIPPYGSGVARAREYAASRANQPAPKPLLPPTITAADLMQQAYRPPKWAVPDLVPEGLTILAGKPKTGKSWLALDFCVSVAAGGYALGNVKCDGGYVLYLALEDTLRRLQGRLRAVLQGEQAPKDLQIATEWQRTDKGGLIDLQSWLRVHKDARLIVIDTLQKMRGSRPRDAGIYEDDYKSIADFKKLADEFTVPLILVHHQNKAGNSDPLMAVSGTAGITGAADTILTIEREPNDAHAILYVRGRDVTEAEVAIQFDNETGKWLKLGKAQDWRISEERKAIVKVLMDGGSMSPNELAVATGKKAGAIRVLLHRMKKDGEIHQSVTGKYSL
jgi:hypothetical protein